MKTYQYSLAALMSIGLFFASCQFQQESGTTSLADTLLSKTITFPRSLQSLEGDRFRSLGSALGAMEGQSKVLSIVDGTCMACITTHLNRMDSVMSGLTRRGRYAKMVFILNIDPRDSSYFMRNLQPAINARGIILWDSSYHFERENSLLTPDEYLRTFMVDQQNRIILYGNPLMRPSLLEDYAGKLTPKM